MLDFPKYVILTFMVAYVFKLAHNPEVGGSNPPPATNLFQINNLHLNHCH